MAETSRHDAWQAGASYDSYMGRWSRLVAPLFLDWLDLGRDLDWLDVGCGTGALSASIIARCEPRSLVGIDPAEGFIAHARSTVTDERAEFRVGDAQALPVADHSRDVVVSSLVLNFVPDRKLALAEMMRVARPGGTVAFCVWDYPGGGVEFMRAFWRTAVSLDPRAADLSEDKRFPFCTREGLADLATEAGLRSIASIGIEVPTVFRDFDDYWHPFTLGAGPAPGYCVSLEPAARECLRDKLRETLPSQSDGRVALQARAWAVRGEVP